MIITCKEIQIKYILQDYIEDDLPTDKKLIVDEHLKKCGDCASEIAMLKLMASEPVPDPGEGFWKSMPQAIYAKIEAEDAKKKRKNSLAEIWKFILGYRLVWVPAAAALLAVFALFPLTNKQDGNMISDNSLGAEYLIDDRRSAVVDIQALGEEEFNMVASWADGKLSSVGNDIAPIFTGNHENVYGEIWEMDQRQLDQLDRLLDNKKEV